MPPLYVVKQGAKLRIRKKRLGVEYDGEVVTSFPLHHISQVVLFGNVGLTTPTIGTLLKKKIEVVFLYQDGSYKGSLQGGVSPHVPLRKAQYALLDAQEFRLKLAKEFVRAKLAHQLALLKRQDSRKEKVDCQEELTLLETALQKIPHKQNLNSLRGLEGTASAAYFGAYRTLFGEEWGFHARNRRPPRDPINVLLSFGYTLITRAASSAVRTVGLDVYAGFLHAVNYNRPSLALDLVEEFRPVIDGLTLWCIKTGQIAPDNFKPGSGKYPIRLDDPGMKTFLSAYEKRMKRRSAHPVTGTRLTLRRSMIEQARQIARSIQEKDPAYQPMGFR